MSRWGRVVGALLVLAAIGCGWSDAGSRVAESASIHDAESLAAAIGSVAGDTDVGVFLIDGADVTVLGDRERLYSFDSITKTIVGLALARLDEQGTLPMATRLDGLLDAGRNGHITLEQLATHESGLPRLAPNSDDWPGFDLDNPYAGYTAELAEEGLRAARLDERGVYSNFGFQLLGLAIERAMDRRLGAVVAELVLEPAGMATATLSQEPGTLPPGRRNGEPSPAWDAPLGGAGGVHGTIDDLVAYARSLLDPPPELAVAVRAAVTPRAFSGEMPTGLAWVHLDGFAWHNGGSSGYSSMIVLDLDHGRAAGYLAASGDLDGDTEQLVFEVLAHRRAL